MFILYFLINILIAESAYQQHLDTELEALYKKAKRAQFIRAEKNPLLVNFTYDLPFFIEVSKLLEQDATFELIINQYTNNLPNNKYLDLVNYYLHYARLYLLEDNIRLKYYNQYSISFILYYLLKVSDYSYEFFDNNKTINPHFSSLSKSVLSSYLNINNLSVYNLIFFNKDIISELIDLIKNDTKTNTQINAEYKNLILYYLNTIYEILLIFKNNNYDTYNRINLYSTLFKSLKEILEPVTKDANNNIFFIPHHLFLKNTDFTKLISISPDFTPFNYIVKEAELFTKTSFTNHEIDKNLIPKIINGEIVLRHYLTYQEFSGSVQYTNSFLKDKSIINIVYYILYGVYDENLSNRILVLNDLNQYSAYYNIIKYFLMLKQNKIEYLVFQGLDSSFSSNFIRHLNNISNEYILFNPTLFQGTMTHYLIDAFYHQQEVLKKYTLDFNNAINNSDIPVPNFNLSTSFVFPLKTHLEVQGKLSYQKYADLIDFIKNHYNIAPSSLDFNISTSYIETLEDLLNQKTLSYLSLAHKEILYNLIKKIEPYMTNSQKNFFSSLYEHEETVKKYIFWQEINTNPSLVKNLNYDNFIDYLSFGIKQHITSVVGFDISIPNETYLYIILLRLNLINQALNIEEYNLDIMTNIVILNNYILAINVTSEKLNITYNKKYLPKEALATISNILYNSALPVEIKNTPSNLLRTYRNNSFMPVQIKK